MLFLLFIIGLPGCGKSTVAHAIASQCGFIHLSTEDIRAELFNGELRSNEDCDFTPNQQEVSYCEMEMRVKEHLAQGRSVIVDGVYRNYAQRKSILEIIQNYRSCIIPLMYWMICDEPELEMRLIKRKQSKSSAPAGVYGYRKIKKEFVEPAESEFVRYDTTEGTEYVIERILTEIRSYQK